MGYFKPDFLPLLSGPGGSGVLVGLLLPFALLLFFRQRTRLSFVQEAAIWAYLLTGTVVALAVLSSFFGRGISSYEVSLLRIELSMAAIAFFLTLLGPLVIATEFVFRLGSSPGVTFYPPLPPAWTLLVPPFVVTLTVFAAGFAIRSCTRCSFLRQERLDQG